MTPVRNSHCSFCGAAFAENQPWPRTCAGCGQVSYRNPTPVAVLLVPFQDGIVAVRRAIPPGVGKLALPGGFINLGESWQAAGARELFEETQLRVDPAQVRDFRVLSAPDSTLLVFGLAAPLVELPPFQPTDETSERVLLSSPVELAFSLHTQVLAEYFARR